MRRVAPEREGKPQAPLTLQSPILAAVKSFRVLNPIAIKRRMQITVNCFQSDILYTQVSAFIAAAVSDVLLVPPVLTVTIVFKTFEAFEVALETRSTENTAQIATSLASFPFFVRDTIPWQNALFNPESTGFIALAIAAKDAEDSPRIVAIASIA